MNTLKQAVIEQLGYESENDEELIQVCEDISNHGIGGGFGGFIYYNETIKFFDDNKEDIMVRLGQLADEIGMNKYDLIVSFSCLNKLYSVDQVVDGIYIEGDENESQIKNALSWFAAEEIAREIAGA